MKRKAAFVSITIALLFSMLLSGCGVDPEKYNEIAANLSRALEETAEIRDENDSLARENEAMAAQLEESRAAIEKLEKQMNKLVEQYQLVGADKAETAENIVRYYYETHTYEENDVYVCYDMAADVWNMLKAQGISAKIVVGNTGQVIESILDSNHAWVLAEVEDGEELALETTNGTVVPRDENSLYYRGWSFSDPKELKSFQELRREYNVRVGIIKEIDAEDREVIEEHNRSTDPVTADRLKAVHEELVELIEMQQAELSRIETEINGLSNKCGG